MSPYGDPFQRELVIQNILSKAKFELTLKISSQSAYNFLSYTAYKRTENK